MHNPPKEPCNRCTYRLTHRHTVQQHHTACVQTIHTHPPPATSQQPTNQQTNQPTNQPPHQPAKLSCARTNQPTTNQPTQQPTKQPENQQPTNQQARCQCTRGGGLQNLGGGGTKHTTDPHSSTVHNPAGGGGAREEGWWEGGTCTLDNPTPQTHMAGRREGVTHLPLGVTVYPLLDNHIGKKNQHTCKEARNTLPNLRQNKRGPTTQTTTWKGGGGADSLTLRGCLCGA